MAIAFELFPAGKQTILNKWSKGDISRYDFAKNYYYLWDYYSKILEYSKKERIPIVGINADRGLIEKVSKSGPKVLSENLKKKFKFSYCLKDTDYAKQLRLDRKRGYHSALFPFLCDGQRLRDSVMAYNIASFIKKTDYTLVVFTGVAHALKIAVPGMLQEHIDVSYKVLMPKSVKIIIGKEPDIGVADYGW